MSSKAFVGTPIASAIYSRTDFQHCMKQMKEGEDLTANENATPLYYADTSPQSRKGKAPALGVLAATCAGGNWGPINSSAGVSGRNGPIGACKVDELLSGASTLAGMVGQLGPPANEAMAPGQRGPCAASTPSSSSSEAEHTYNQSLLVSGQRERHAYIIVDGSNGRRANIHLCGKRYSVSSECLPDALTVAVSTCSQLSGVGIYCEGHVLASGSPHRQ